MPAQRTLEKFETRSVRQVLRQARVYCITMPQDTFAEQVDLAEAACRGGADVLQLREKNRSVKDLLALSMQLKEVCREYGALFIVNDRLDVALAAGADGVHLGQDDLPLPEARAIANRHFNGSANSFVIGCSTHSLDQARRAQSQGADYLGCGPIFSTPTKPAYGAVGLNLVSRYRAEIEMPFVAIGGIDESNIDSVIQAGAPCVAVVRAAFEDKNSVEARVRSLKNRFGGEMI